jgi:hypothetical protein
VAALLLALNGRGAAGLAEIRACNQRQCTETSIPSSLAQKGRSSCSSVLLLQARCVRYFSESARLFASDADGHGLHPSPCGIRPFARLRMTTPPPPPLSTHHPVYFRRSAPEIRPADQEVQPGRTRQPARGGGRKPDVSPAGIVRLHRSDQHRFRVSFLARVVRGDWFSFYLSVAHETCQGKDLIGYASRVNFQTRRSGSSSSTRHTT